MKKVHAYVLCVLLVLSSISIPVFGANDTVKHELWSMNTGLSAYTTDDIRIFKAMEEDFFYLYELPQLGSNYYLGMVEAQTNKGGYNNKSETSDYYYYTLLATNDSFIILDTMYSNNEYFWNKGHSFVDLTGEVDRTYYENKGYAAPLYMFNSSGKYTNSNYDEYNEYFIIGSDGHLYRVYENDEEGCAGEPTTFSSKLYMSYDRYESGSNWYYYYLSDETTKAYNFKEMFLSNGIITYGTATKRDASYITAANGYKIYEEGFSSTESRIEMFKMPKSNNRFVKVEHPAMYNESAKRYYYDVKITVYEKVDSGFSVVNEYYDAVQATSKSTFTAYMYNNLNDSNYTSKGYSPIRMRIGEYFVMEDGNVAKLNLDATKFKYADYYKTNAVYNGMPAIVRSYDGSSSIYHTDASSTSTYKYYWQKVCYIYFDSSGKTVLGSETEFRVGKVTGLDGYFSNYYTYVEPTGITAVEANKSKEWWGRCPNNVFPDGRYVTCSWEKMTDDTYELWYNIYSSEDELISTGMTGFYKYYYSSFDLEEVITYAINNSKFVATLKDINSSWATEYYRYSVTEENVSGEVITSGQLGEKKITPPDDSDTEVVESTINFGDTELPIGYNIKENVVNTDNLELELRDQVNAIRLNDIVIVAEPGYISGYQNTGSSLASFSQYDYDFGDDYIRVYSNGQNFRWYCYYPESLIPGTYRKTYMVGDRTIYVTFKIINPPINTSSVTVVF